MGKIKIDPSLKTFRDRLHLDRDQPNLAESLAYSRTRRRDMIAKFGFVPMSVLKINRGKLSREIFIFQHERGMLQARANKVNALDSIKSDASKTRHRQRLALGLTGCGSVMDQRKKGAFRLQVTIMPAELVEFFAKYYAAAGQTYIDPFMGQGVQLQVAAILGMNYVGFDVSREYVAYIQAIRKLIKRTDVRIDAHLHDARRMMEIVKPESADFCFTSPPYWDTEFYGDEPDQLGNATYPEFMASMKTVADQLFQAFRPGGFAVINVGDIRKGGRFYPYHSDLTRAFQEVGWDVHDVWVIDGLVGGLSKVFAVNRNSDLIAPKTHEYALVFRKPANGRSSTGVQGLDDPSVQAKTAEQRQTARPSGLKTRRPK